MIRNRQRLISGVTKLDNYHIPFNGLVSTTNLVAYYNLDETSGTTVTDSTNSYNGTNSGATVNQTGKIGKCYSFTTASVTKITSSVVFNTNFSISWWQKTNDASSGSYQISICAGTGRTACFNCFIYNNKFAIGCISNSVFESGTSATNNWQHIVMIIEQATPAKCTLYCDNKKIINQATMSVNSISNFVIGVRPDNDGDRFNGLIDEVGIWNRVLTSDEITALYNNGNGLTY